MNAVKPVFIFYGHNVLLSQSCLSGLDDGEVVEFFAADGKYLLVNLKMRRYMTKLIVRLKIALAVSGIIRL